MPKTYFLILSLAFSLESGLCLYEDQIGKFDWKKEFVGEVGFNIV